VNQKGTEEVPLGEEWWEREALTGAIWIVLVQARPPEPIRNISSDGDENENKEEEEYGDLLRDWYALKNRSRARRVVGCCGGRRQGIRVRSWYIACKMRISSTVTQSTY
jgi:hypothetical protein